VEVGEGVTPLRGAGAPVALGELVPEGVPWGGAPGGDPEGEPFPALGAGAGPLVATVGGRAYPGMENGAGASAGGELGPPGLVMLGSKQGWGRSVAEGVTAGALVGLPAGAPVGLPLGVMVGLPLGAPVGALPGASPGTSTGETTSLVGRGAGGVGTRVGGW
jgi:hypothetical protein